ncbi:packaged DNA stabilization protein [Acinetobacter haemolyticus]|uniref:packaged DNA stabilization protein n=1 Tax=Acinetobacter haemolyticus TaxID=29430 RepID=UPI003F57A104
MIKLPLVGPAYKLNAQSMSCQNCINWYPQTIEYPNGSRVAALMPTPGLKKIFQGDSASVRCLHVLSNGALLAVIGKKLYHSKANRFDPQYVGDVSGLGTVKAADNGIVAIIVNGTYSYSLDMKTLEFKRLSGSTIPRSTHVLFLDGRFVVNKANTGQFYWSDLYSNKFDALSYATAESSPDKITALVTFNRELWIFGAQTVERYYSSGSQTSPYARLSGGAMAFGCTAPDSIVALATGVIWLSLSEFGGHQIVMSGGGVPERISTHAIEEEIASYIKTSDAIAYAYQQEGHVFYVISFPSASTTFCFDVSTGLWHQRSYASQQGLHERHRSQHHAFFNGIHIVGDYKNGKLYQLDKQTYTDDGDLILRERTAQAVITDGKLTRFNNLEIVCEVGFGDRKPKPTPQPPVISCVGALNITDWIDINGVWGLEVEGELITESAAILEVIDLLRANNFEVIVEEEPEPDYGAIVLGVDNDATYQLLINGVSVENTLGGGYNFNEIGSFYLNDDFTPNSPANEIVDAALFNGFSSFGTKDAFLFPESILGNEPHNQIHFETYGEIVDLVITGGATTHVPDFELNGVVCSNNTYSFDSATNTTTIRIGRDIPYSYSYVDKFSRLINLNVSNIKDDFEGRSTYIAVGNMRSHVSDSESIRSTVTNGQVSFDSLNLGSLIDDALNAGYITEGEPIQLVLLAESPTAYVRANMFIEW